MKFSMPLGKSRPDSSSKHRFFKNYPLHTHTHTHTHTPAEKGEGTIKVYLNRDVILQGSLKTLKLLFTKLYTSKYVLYHFQTSNFNGYLD